MKWWRQLAGIILALVVIAAVYAFTVWQKFLTQPLLPSNASPITLQISPGITVIRMGYLLSQETQNKHPQLWVWLVSSEHALGKIQAGEYLITPQMTVRDLLDNMIHGKVVVHHVAFIEGWTFAQMKEALAQASGLDDSLTAMSDADLMAKLGMPGALPEGLFFPDTYNYVWRQTAFVILKNAFDRMQQNLLSAWAQREPNLLYTNPYQALIVASMIEKETAVPAERPIVAEVILRRLEKHMRLQIDPTVVYGLGLPYGSPITKGELQTDTPYNTYTRFGLPPTPICMPSLSSIQAALHPDMTHYYLYYVSKGNGTHQFSDTYAGQRSAINRYIFHRAPPSAS